MKRKQVLGLGKRLEIVREFAAYAFNTELYKKTKGGIAENEKKFNKLIDINSNLPPNVQILIQREYYDKLKKEFMEFTEKYNLSRDLVEECWNEYQK